MKDRQKWLLALAVVCLAIGIPVTFCGLGASPFWTLALPLGMVFLGLYLVAFVLRKEVARFDAEQRAKTGSTQHSRPHAPSEVPAGRSSTRGQ